MPDWGAEKRKGMENILVPKALDTVTSDLAVNNFSPPAHAGPEEKPPWNRGCMEN